MKAKLIVDADKANFEDKLNNALGNMKENGKTVTDIKFTVGNQGYIGLILTEKKGE